MVKELSAVGTRESVAASALRELRELADSSDDPGQFGELIGLFLGELESGVVSMRKALAQGNAVVLSRLAHSLKGSSASMGARTLAVLCQTLEGTAKSAELQGVEAQLEQIESEVHLVREALEKEAAS
jgi:HPt (histidine-containing phosphotransfer) domain-containing protein